MEEVSELQPIPDAHVPVMKFKFSGVSIDLLYARLSLWVIPEVSAGLSKQQLIFCDSTLTKECLLYYLLVTHY